MNIKKKNLPRKLNSPSSWRLKPPLYNDPLKFVVRFLSSLKYRNSVDNWCKHERQSLISPDFVEIRENSEKRRYKYCNKVTKAFFDLIERINCTRIHFIRTISFLDARWHFTFYILHFLQNKNKTLGTKYVLSTG